MDPMSKEIELFFSLESFAHRSLWKANEAVWHPLLILKKYLDAFTGKIEVEIPQGVFLQNRERIFIGEGTIIEPGVFIQGPCVIGKGCTIRHGAYIREYVLCGNECQIGHSAEVKHSILLDKAAATHFTYVGDSILGNGANLGAGVKCANLRLDRQEVKEGLKKMGAIVGDRVQIGCNAVLNPGTLVGKESFAHPLTLLKGQIPPRSQIDKEGVRPIEKTILEKLLWTSTSSAPR